MPIVPTYDIPQVTPGALPSARQTTPDHLMAANTIGAEQQVSLGAAAQQFGNTLNDIEVAHQIQVNENRAKDADTAYMTGANAILHGTPDDKGNPSPNAYLTKMGGDAVNSFEATTKALNDLKQKALDGLDNDAQRAAAKHILETRYEAFAMKAAAHKEQQLKVYGLASATSRAEAASDSAKTLYNPITDKPVLSYDAANPEKNTPYQQNLQTAKVEANHIVDLQYGVNAAPDVRAQMVKAQMEKVYVGITGHLYESGKAGDGSTQIAKGYFDQVKGELSPAVRDDIQGKLHAAATQDRVLTYSDQIFDTVRGEKAQMSQVRKDFEAGKLDGKERELIEARIEHRAAKSRQDDNEYTASVVGQAQDFFIKNPGKSVTDLPKGLYLALERKGNLASIDGFAKRGGNIPGNNELYNRLMDSAVNTPEAFVKVDPASFMTQLSTDQLNHVWAAQRGINKQDLQQQQGDKLVHNTISAVKSSMLAARINLNPKPGTSDADTLDQFNADLRGALYQAMQQKKGTPLTQNEASEIARDMLKEQALTGMLWDSHKPVFKMTPEEKAATWTVPDEDRRQIIAALQSNKMPVTEANIQRLYKQKSGVR